MTEFALATAHGQDRAHLAAECAAQLRDNANHTLGFVYVTSPLAGSLSVVIETLRANTAVQSWVGTVGYGICASGEDYFNEPAIVALTGTFTPDEYKIITSISSSEELSNWNAAGFFAGMGVVHADPRNPASADLVSEFAEKSAAYLVGGLTSGEDTFPQVAGDITDGGISGVLIGGRRQLAIGLTQGCSPIGTAHTITSSQGNALITLNDRPALEVLYEDAGICDDDDPRQALASVHAALLVGAPESGDYLVRHLVGIDPAKGVIAIADDASDTRQLMFVRRDAVNAATDIERMLDDLQTRTTLPPKAGLYYSCVARGPQLFSDEAYEMKAIKDRFGDIPIVGFFGNGEISNNRIYAYTGVLTLFC